MPERFQPAQYNPDDPNYRENQSFENNEGKVFDQSNSALQNDGQSQSPPDGGGQPSKTTNDAQANYDRFKSEQLQGNYGQPSEATNAAQANYDQFKSEQLQGNYGQSSEPNTGSDDLTGGDAGGESYSSVDSGSGGSGGSSSSDGSDLI